MNGLLRHARVATPWRMTLVIAVLVVLLLEAVRRWPWQAWPLQNVAVGLLAGGVAWCLDEPAALVVDVGPRPLVWRSAARLGGVALLAAAWGVGLWRAWDRLFDHPTSVALQGVGAMVAAAAWTSARRASGVPRPGHQLALVVVPVTTAWALVRPLQTVLPIFPYGYDASYGDWQVSAIGWSVLTIISALWLLLTLSEVGPHRRLGPGQELGARSGQPFG